MTSRIPVHVEVAVRQSAQPAEIIRQHVLAFLQSEAQFSLGSLELPSDNPLATYVEIMEVTQLGTTRNGATLVSFWQADLKVHVFTLSDVPPEADVIEAPDGDGGEDMSPCSQFILPRRDFQGLWGSLVLEPGCKERLVDFASSSLHFAAAGVQPHVISSNRMVLLHGPPGTGKTTLCKALAQKLAVRLSHVYEGAVLVEIHSHSLFSKWFSESGKLVARLFEHIQELVDDESCMVCLLIDEVESLTSARSSAASSSEPSDAVRVVNAILTQLDRLKRFPNVLTLCTTNLASSIDAAFVDRADIKAFIGLPPTAGCYTILRDCMEELMRVGLVAPPLEIAPVRRDLHVLLFAAFCARALAQCNDTLSIIWLVRYRALILMR